MKKILLFVALALIFNAFLAWPNEAEAKTSYYRSAKSGRFTTKSFSNSHKSTTYRSYFR